MDQRVASRPWAPEGSSRHRGDFAAPPLEEKLSDHDGALARLGAMAAAVHGQVQGLGESAAQCSRWAASVDGKLEALCSQVEERFQRGASDLEAAAAASEDGQAELGERLRREHAAVQEQASHSLALAEALAGEQERLRGVEAASTRAVVDLQDRMASLEASDSRSKRAEGSLGSRLAHLESQLQDQGRQIGRLQAASGGEGGWGSRLCHLETVLAAMRSKLESHQEYSSRIDDAVRQRWAGRIDQLERLAEGQAARSRGLEEKHELLAQQGGARHDGLARRLQQLERGSRGLWLLDPGGEEAVQDELLSGQITPVHEQLPGMRGGWSPVALAEGGLRAASARARVESLAAVLASPDSGSAVCWAISQAGRKCSPCLASSSGADFSPALLSPFP
ncbi:unnamed protein product, partial [Prorocentrum cordatum]